jgi:hypothetical protein
VSRLNRAAPLPSTQMPQVSDAAVQRAFDSLSTPLAAVVKFLLPFVQPEAWKFVVFQNSFVDYKADFHRVAYRKNPLGRVELRGLVNRSAASLNSVIFNLPVGYRPAKDCMFMVSAADLAARLDIRPDGTVTMRSAVSATWFNYFSLEGITFDTEA